MAGSVSERVSVDVKVRVYACTRTAAILRESKS